MTLPRGEMSDRLHDLRLRLKHVLDNYGTDSYPDEEDQDQAIKSLVAVVDELTHIVTELADIP